MAATVLGFVTRFVFALALADVFFFSNNNSTAISGFSSAGGSDANSGFDSAFAEAFAFVTTFAVVSGPRPPRETTFAAAFLTGTGPTSNSGDLGAAFATAEVFFGTTGETAGLVSTTGSAAIAGFAFALRLLPFKALGSATLAATLRGFFAAVFFTVFARFTFELLAPVLARLRVVRGERGWAAVFFGFFMATILATGRSCFWRVRPVFRWRNGYLIFGPRAERRVTLRDISQ